MAGIALILHLDGRPAEERELAPVRDAMRHRGPDGCATVVDGPLALAVHRFRTTPEEAGEVQPLRDPESGAVLALDGRLDNREELLGELEKRPGELAGVSDAEVALAAWKRWGDSWIERAVGPVAAVVAEPVRRRATLYRDALGHRPLAFAVRGRTLVVASEPWAVTRHPVAGTDPNLRSVVRLLALDGPVPGETFFREVAEVAAGERVRVTPVGVSGDRWWAPRVRPWVTTDPDEATELFLDALREAVRAALRAPEPPVVQMSGGLDSTTVAALAREALAAGGGGPLRVVSWVAPGDPAADESRWIAAMERELGLEVHRIEVRGAPEWALAGLRVDPSWPFSHPLWWLLQLARQEVRRLGGRVMLDGHFADHLFQPWNRWFGDLAVRGRLPLAVGLLAREIGIERRRGGDVLGPLRRAASSLVRRRPRAAPPAAPWLTERGRRILLEAWEDDPTAGWPPPARAIAGPLSAVDGASATAEWGTRGPEQRHPFADRRVVELALRLPADLLDRPGERKRILRRATVGLLPAEVRERTEITSLAAFTADAMWGRHARRVREAIRDGEPLWGPFLSRREVQRVLEGAPRNDRLAAAVFLAAGLSRWNVQPVSPACTLETSGGRVDANEA